MDNTAPEYLDTQKSVMISSPAGSGKTEKLARRYIALLKAGSQVERILAITFTEKAAAEMKERIISILKREDPQLFERQKAKIPRMRISTIHAFCRKLLKRFSIELGLDTDMDVMEPFQADILWTEAVYEALMLDADSDRIFKKAVSRLGIKGWSNLYNALKNMHSKRTSIETGLKENSIGFAGDSQCADELLAIYRKCLARYMYKKKTRRLLDFNDLELIAYEAISTGNEWHNILFSFDEHTDHMLVDEFQDTSMLQWKIIDKLTEEWRAGLGAKRESGRQPTIFLVGDDKQSIYSFRGADVEIFRNTRKKLDEWLGTQYSYIEVTRNYRSLPAVVSFVNDFFSRYMQSDMFGSGYRNFEATRTGEGHVELMMINIDSGIRENRKAEAAALSRRINELHGMSSADSGKYTFGDMAVLLRKRTHITAFEEAFKKAGIPFIVLKGIGFYEAPEVNFMRSIAFFLIDLNDDYSLFNLLRSRIFNISYKELKRLFDAYFTKANGQSLFGYLQVMHGAKEPSVPIQDMLWSDESDTVFADAYRTLSGWIDKTSGMRLSVALELLMSDTGAWRFFSDRQRHLNARKFIRVIEAMEAKGFSRAEMRESLLRASDRDESKANVNAEGMDAVRIMTIHAAKGLQFPVVFLPCMDETSRSSSAGLTVIEEEDRVVINQPLEGAKPGEIQQRLKEKEQEEDKRIFYVAATRAMDRLYMSGVSGSRPSGRLGALIETYGLDLAQGSSPLLPPFVYTVIDPSELKDSAEQIRPLSRYSGNRPSSSQIVFTAPVAVGSGHAAPWTDVTEEIQRIGKAGSEDWAVHGRAFHSVFELISRGTANSGNMDDIIRSVLRSERLSASWFEKMFYAIKKDIAGLVEKGYYQDILQKQESAYFELPFVLNKDDRIFRGRIDRVIIKDGIVHIYDYKTFPVRDNELRDVAAGYAAQIDLYRAAAEELFGCSSKAYILFTHIPQLVEL